MPMNINILTTLRILCSFSLFSRQTAGGNNSAIIIFSANKLNQLVKEVKFADTTFFIIRQLKIY